MFLFARLRPLARALGHPSYRNYAIGNSVSVVGTWIQRIAAGWLAWELTHSGAWIGALAFMELFPSTVFGPIGGALVDRRIFPSINIERSGTRKEELLYHPDEYNRITVLRRALTGVPPVEAMDLLLGKLKKTPNNIMFLLSMGGGKV